ncbi:MAG: membrane protein insertase YidC [Pseudomonadota bacterium]
MDNQRLFLWAALGLVYLMLYNAWVADHRPQPGATPPAEQAAALPQAAEDGQLPALADDLPPAPQTGDMPSAAEVAPTQAPPRGQTITVRTDVLDVEINTEGGDISRAELPAYPVNKKDPDNPVQLLSSQTSDLYLLQAGLRAVEASNAPTHLASFEAGNTSYELADGQEALDVVLTWRSGTGVVVEKIYTFGRGRYDIQLNYRVTNNSAQSWSAAPYLQLKRRHRPAKRSMVSVDSYSFTGPVYYDGSRYDKLDVDDLKDEPLDASLTNGWLASIEHHFLAAAVPPVEQSYRFTSRVDSNDVYTLSAIGPLAEVAAGSTRDYNAQLFVGPKLQRQLEETAPGLKLSVDYGFLTILSQPLFAVLQFIHNLVGNWGWSIILLTILIKLAFYPLQEKSGRSIAKMRKLQPRMKELQERHKDDRQALSQAVMEMYRKEKANPAAGCLPVLLQMPVFLALYWVLIESVEMRQAPFALWITDLSSRDPYFILPALMAGAMFLQQKLNPPPPDPVQAKVMMFLPLIFSVFFAFFPAGLVLYWVVNTVLSVAQQWKINRAIEAEG